MPLQSASSLPPTRTKAPPPLPTATEQLLRSPLQQALPPPGLQRHTAAPPFCPWPRPPPAAAWAHSDPCPACLTASPPRRPHPTAPLLVCPFPAISPLLQRTPRKQRQALQMRGCPWHPPLLRSLVRQRWRRRVARLAARISLWMASRRGQAWLCRSRQSNSSNRRSSIMVGRCMVCVP